MVESRIVNAVRTMEPKPPVGVIDALSAGFDTVLRHLGLLVIPILLDVLLWVGPTVNIQPLIDRFAVASQSLIASVPDQQTRSQMEVVSQGEVKVFTAVSQRLNVLDLISTSPVGVPSLMVERLLDSFNQTDPIVLFTNSDWRIAWRIIVGDGAPAILSASWQTATAGLASLLMFYNLAALVQPGFDPARLVVQTPVQAGGQLSLPLTNELQFFLLVVALPLAGLLLSAVYYGQIGSLLREPAMAGGHWLRRSAINWAKLTAFNLAFRLVLVCLGLPLLLVSALLLALGINMGGVLVPFLMTAGVWFMLYISYAMQSFVLHDRGVIGAMWDSIRVVHVNLIPVAGLAGLSLLLNWGMTYVFNLADNGSWLTALGIVGHAFLSTSLVTTTFIFYKDRYRWWAEMRQWAGMQARGPR